ncbi:shikimate dehydrogenase [soil metagenome]
MKRIFGLIGQTLKHSFSKNYFTEKFRKENIQDCSYELFELENINFFSQLISDNLQLVGLNVTIPYKEQVIPYLTQLDASAEKVGAVNVIKINSDQSLTGFNSDYYGFKTSLENWIPQYKKPKALVLGTGGSSRAVFATLKDLGIKYISVSRNATDRSIDYQQLKKRPEILKEHLLVINTTPVGMYPKVDQAPELDYNLINSSHYLYDLVYNPTKTLFLEKGLIKGAKIKNGLEMLHLQAEKSWEIWNS